MQRQPGVGLLTKIARNGLLINVISRKSVSPSSFPIPNSIPFHRRSLSEYSTLSRSHSWKICCPNGLRGTIQNGALPSSLLARRVFSNALLQGRAKFPVTFRNRRSMASFSLDSRRRSFFRRFIPDRCVVLLIATNVLVFLLWRVAPYNVMVINFVMSEQHLKCGLLYTVITNAFCHIEVEHLIGNMLLLSIFGTRIARKFGPQYLLKLYLGGATAGSIFCLLYQAFVAPSVEVKQPSSLSYQYHPTWGANAAVGAIMVMDILLLPPVGALLGGVMIVIGMDMLSRRTLSIHGSPRMRFEWKEKEVSEPQAHIGGGAAAGAVAWLWKRKKGRVGRLF